MFQCNFLHCIEQSPNADEGVNQLVDGFKVCEQLRNYDAQMFKVLANTPVEWIHVGKEGTNDLYHVYRAPVIWLVFFNQVLDYFYFMIVIIMTNEVRNRIMG